MGEEELEQFKKLPEEEATRRLFDAVFPPEGMEACRTCDQLHEIKEGVTRASDDLELHFCSDDCASDLNV